jgi:ectoine hydroxylase-related dioxygenase (phytanoyl-CoA dioxygenase family)
VHVCRELTDRDSCRSHKSNFRHPLLHQHSDSNLGQMSADAIEEAVEVYMQKGDVLLFTDAIAHGSAKRSAKN